ncbi:MAG: hypothetical protein ACQESG_05405 [Nanobdellota archaeon]
MEDLVYYKSVGGVWGPVDMQEFYHDWNHISWFLWDINGTCLPHTWLMESPDRIPKYLDRRGVPAYLKYSKDMNKHNVLQTDSNGDPFTVLLGYSELSDHVCGTADRKTPGFVEPVPQHLLLPEEEGLDFYKRYEVIGDLFGFSLDECLVYGDILERHSARIAGVRYMQVPNYSGHEEPCFSYRQLIQLN